MKRKHQRYYRIPGYQILAKLSDQDVAKTLNICVRTYKNKIAGYSDFTAAELNTLSELFRVPIPDLVKTED